MITQDQETAAFQLYEEQGVSCRQIAKRFGGTPSLWYHRFVKAGAVPLGGAEIRYLPASGKFKPFTPHEDAALLRFSVEGVSYEVMGRRLDRPRSSCRARLYYLARCEAEAA